MKKLLCFLLAMLMLLTVLVGCRKTEEDEASDDVTENTGTETTNPYDVYDDLGDLKFGTSANPVDFTVLQWDGYQPDWCTDASEKDANNVTSELYERQIYMEDRFGIAISIVEVGGKGNSSAEIQSKIEASVSSGSHSYDLVGHFSDGASATVTNGYSYNLLDVDYLNLSKSYWPKDMLATNTVNNQMYFLTGYLAPSYFGCIEAVFYNKELMEDLGFVGENDPVALVDNNKWTFETFKQMTSNLYEDNTQKGTSGADIEDKYGLVFNSTANPIDAMPVAFGIRMMEVDAENGGKLVLSGSCSSTRGVGIVGEINKFVAQNENVYVVDGDDNVPSYGYVFHSGNALFTVDQLNNIPQFIEKADFEIGAVPLPKYNVDQGAYYCALSKQFTLFTIPADAKDPDMTGAILEALEAYSYREIFPVIYEQNFKAKYSADTYMSRMVTLIYESALLDPAVMWGKGADLYWEMRTSVYNPTVSWKRVLDEHKDTVWKGNIDKLNNYLFR